MPYRDAGEKPTMHRQIALLTAAFLVIRVDRHAQEAIPEPVLVPPQKELPPAVS